MKKIAFLALIMMLAFACKKHDCKKPKETLANAIITGQDFRACACCGGLMITFSDDPKPYSASFFNIDQLPANSGIGESTKYPLYVKVKYETSPVTCGNHVNILKLEMR